MNIQHFIKPIISILHSKIRGRVKQCSNSHRNSKEEAVVGSKTRTVLHTRDHKPPRPWWLSCHCVIVLDELAEVLPAPRNALGVLCTYIFCGENAFLVANHNPLLKIHLKSEWNSNCPVTVHLYSHLNLHSFPYMAFVLLLCRVSLLEKVRETTLLKFFRSLLLYHYNRLLFLRLSFELLDKGLLV